MPNKPIEMYKIRQILRHYANGKGCKFIFKTTGVARNTARKYVIQFASLRLTIEAVEKMSDGKLASVFLLGNPKSESNRIIELSALLPELAAMLRKRDVNKQLVYEHYAKLYPSGLKHSALGVRLNSYVGMVKPSMRLSHKVGDKHFIDFTGNKLQIVDKDTREIIDIEAFSAIPVRGFASAKPSLNYTPNDKDPCCTYYLNLDINYRIILNYN